MRAVGRAIATAAFTAGMLLHGGAAGASGNLGWRLSGYGSADCNQDGVHVVCIRYGPDYSPGVAVAVDAWIPTWCQWWSVADGDADGDPLRYVWASVDPARACVPEVGGWGDGTGYVEGVMGAGWPVSVDAVPVFGRSGAWAYGTLWRIW